MKIIKSKNIIVLLPLLVLLVLGACQPGNGGSAVSTWTASPSVTPTCAPDIKLSTPEGWGNSSRLVIILFDPQATMEQGLELSDGEQTQDIAFFVNRIILDLMKPGDQTSVFSIGYKKYEDARVTRLYSYITRPQLYNTPSPNETLTPLPKPGTPTPGLVGIATANRYKAALTEQAATATANLAIYDCQIAFWNNDAKLTATAWKQIEISEISSIGEEATKDSGEFETNTDVKRLSFPSYELYDGLIHASRDLTTDCKNYDHCSIVIVDDLLPWVTIEPHNLPIDLTGVSLYVIMPNCRDIYQPSCTVLQDYWDSEFEKFGAEKAAYMNGIRAETNLLNAIGR